MQPALKVDSFADPEPVREPAGTAADTPSDQSIRPASGARRRAAPWLCVLASVVAFPLTIGGFVVATELGAAPAVVARVAGIGFLLVALLALAGLLIGAVRAVKGLIRHGIDGFAAIDVVSGIGITFVSLVMTAFGAIGALFATSGFSRGRQIRRRGRVLLAPVEDGGAWAGTRVVVEGSERVPPGVADQWRENGRTEHASVASFAQLTLDLMALGAPPALVVAANQDALDEIRHTEACFSLASALDGKATSPGAFPEAQMADALPRARTLALAKLAVTSLVDGALHEGVSARIIAKLARRCEEPTIAAVLTGIAADEGRHAAHAWDVVEWCVHAGGLSVARALQGAVGFLPEQMHSERPEGAKSGAWERWGIHGCALEAAEYEATRQHVTRRVRTLVASAVERTLIAAA